MTLATGSLSPIRWLYRYKAVLPVVTTNAVSFNDFTISCQFGIFYPGFPISTTAAMLIPLLTACQGLTN